MILTDAQRIMIDMAASFTADYLRPNAQRWDRDQCLDRKVLQELGGLGFGGIYVEESLGGSGFHRLDAALIFEQLAKGCVSHASFLSIHNMVNWVVGAFGAEGLQQKWVARLSSCEAIASYCLTESGSGSDAASLKTRADRSHDGYILNGAKAFISGGGFSDVYLVMARMGDGKGEPDEGISAFLVENGTSGLSFGKTEEKMGWRAQPIASVHFDDCKVPVQNLVGIEGQGFKYAMMGLNGGRLNIAACSLGGAQEALDRALVYAQERRQFDQVIADFQAIQFKLADMETELQAARAFLYEAARKLDDQESDAAAFCAMAKRFVTDIGFKVANDALQIHGGYGYLAAYDIERIVRDLRVHQILEGTNEIMRVIIARHLLKAGH